MLPKTCCVTSAVTAKPVHVFSDAGVNTGVAIIIIMLTIMMAALCRLDNDVVADGGYNPDSQGTNDTENDGGTNAQATAAYQAAQAFYNVLYL